MGQGAVTTQYLIDTSAWMRLDDDAVPYERIEAVATAVSANEVWASIILRLEVGYSARTAEHHAVDQERLDRLPQASLHEGTGERAVALQRQLAAVGHHRVPPPDLLVMAIAECHDLTVLHYDKDFDVIAERTDCTAESEWLVPRGSV